MNREQAITNLGFGRAFAALAPAPEDSTLQVDLDTLVSVLEALPGYAEVDVVFTGDNRQDEYHIMARDMPGPDRRFTNLTTGFEWLGVRPVIDSVTDNLETKFIHVSRHKDPGQTIWVTL